jgi:tRNA(fMet)-specific endonuclease VapC
MIQRRLHDGGTQAAGSPETPTDVLMKWMLDTNVCIDIIKERPRSVLDRFKNHTVGDIGISVVTLAELEYGVSASGRPAKNREALDQFVSPLEVAPFDRDATAAYGRLRAALEKKGLMIGSMDLLIAAHAVSLDVRLVTHNSREFGRVPGLKIEDWQ